MQTESRTFPMLSGKIIFLVSKSLESPERLSLVLTQASRSDAFMASFSGSKSCKRTIHSRPCSPSFQDVGQDPHRLKICKAEQFGPASRQAHITWWERSPSSNAHSWQDSNEMSTKGIYPGTYLTHKAALLANEQ